MNPFKVLCVDEGYVSPFSDNGNVPPPIIGSTYTVVDIITPRSWGYNEKGCDIAYYVLAEMGEENAYHPTCFALLSGPTVEEIAAEEEGAELDQVFRDIILEAENA
jgi:hypothetical protein